MESTILANQMEVNHSMLQRSNALFEPKKNNRPTISIRRQPVLDEGANALQWIGVKSDGLALLAPLLVEKLDR